MKNPSQLHQFTRVCLHVASQLVPPHFSKFSKHTFTQPQLVVLVCLKLKLGVTYRELVDWLGEMPGIQHALGLKQLPHFTTVQKAFARLSPAVWRVVQRASCALLPSSGLVALDASGWDRSWASRHYTQQLKLRIRSLKTTLLVDTHAQMVLDVHVTATRRHDTRIAPQLAQRNLERFHTLAADKGYDDQSFREWLRGHGKRPLIRHREFVPSDKAANARMDSKIYHRRSLVETVISVLKRKYGSAVSSRVWGQQCCELVAMCLVYNVERAVQLGVSFLDWLWSQLLDFSQRRISTDPP